MQKSQVSTVLYEQSQLESTTAQIMDLILDLLVIKRNKYNDRKRNRPRMIMSDQTILKYLIICHKQHSFLYWRSLLRTTNMEN